jgi:DNA-binding XRE family transcriptional regulator
MNYLRSNGDCSWKAYLVFVNNALCFNILIFKMERVIKMIGDVLKRIRSIYGYKANEMSASLGISPSYLSELENNKKQPSLDLLQKYADMYDIKLSSLILLSEEFDEAKKIDKGNTFIRNMMLHLISSMSKKAGDPD